MMKLYGYWRSSATYRIRILLNLKGVPYDYIPIDLRAGDQRAEPFLERNPQGLVPVIETEDGTLISQSLAIAEYLEETAGGASILPEGPEARAKCRAIAAVIACEAQPFMNLRVQNYLRQDLALEDVAVKEWLHVWCGGAMSAAEALVAPNTTFACGEHPTIADAFIVPQIFGARRFGLNLDPFVRLQQIEAAAKDHPAFVAAHPDRQPDNPETA